MDFIQSLILGIIQGITEFLPISSTAHLVITPWLFLWKDGGLPFNIALHAGSLLAIISYFRNEWLKIIKNFFKCVIQGSFENNHDAKLGIFLIVGTIPAIISGILFEKYASGILRNPEYIAFSLALFAIFLFISDRKSSNQKEIIDLNYIDCLFFGIAQAFAIIPGVSRSGVTITGGLLRNFKRDEAAKFSFLLGAPLIFAATIFESRHLELSSVLSPPFLGGVIASAITAFIVIKYLLRFLKTQNYTIFVVYRLVLAAVIILVSWSKLQ